MSGLGQKQTSGHVRAMSALPPKADIGTKPRDVCFVPKADILRCGRTGASRSPRRRRRAATTSPGSNVVARTEELTIRLPVGRTVKAKNYSVRDRLKRFGRNS